MTLKIILRKDLRVAEMILSGCFQGRRKKDIFELVIGAPEKIGKTNHYSPKNFGSENICFQDCQAKDQSHIGEAIR